MAVGPTLPLELPPIPGLRLAGASAGIKNSGVDDLVLIELCEKSSCVGVFTSNAFCAAPVTIARQHLMQSDTRYLLINSGNANAGTGLSGEQHALSTCSALGEVADVSAQQVLPFSTGVIGEILPVEKINRALPSLFQRLAEENWLQAAHGIMTTDTRPKGASRRFHWEGETVTVTGISKGAGMIKPNMATMLAYVATDAGVGSELLQQMLQGAINKSFNRITVDGDTSTNDAVILMATGKAGTEGLVSTEQRLYAPLYEAIVDVFVELAQAIIRDAEGANKFVAISVTGGATEKECLKVAYTVAESPLVKTALFASDPNWGRILAAIGRAGLQDLEVDKVTLSINDVVIAENGCRATSYTEQQGQAAMAVDEINIEINLGRGRSSETVWTSDLSSEYVRINAEYRS